MAHVYLITSLKDIKYSLYRIDGTRTFPRTSPLKILMLMRNQDYSTNDFDAQLSFRPGPSLSKGALCPGIIFAGPQAVRSAEQGDLVVPRVRLATAQRRSFAVVGPSLWNALRRLRSELLALSLPLFRSRLKTILFDHGLVLLGRECL